MIGKDLTKGSVAKTLFRFTIPFFVANFLHTLYGIVDMYIVGRFTDAKQLASVTLGSAAMFFFNGLIMGLGSGATVLVGQIFGAKKEQDEQETVATIFSFFPMVAVFLLAACQILTPVILRFLNAAPESWDGAVSYLRICSIGLIFSGFFFAIAGVLRGMGDSKGPTVFIAVATVFNIIGDYICVGPLHMGPAGAALATSAAQGLSVVLGYFYLRRHHFPFDFRPKSYHIYGDKLKKLLRIAIPTALQEVLTSISFLVMESIINKMGYVATAAVGVCNRVFNLCILPANSFSAAIAAMVAQNTGAGEYRRSRKTMWTGAAIGFVITLIFFAMLAISPESIIGSFSKDENVIAAGASYMTFLKFDCLIFTIAFCINGYINGTGHTRYTMIVNLVASFAVRLPLVWLISRMAGATLRQIGLGVPAASLVQLLVGIGFLLFAKSEREQREKLRAEL